MSDNDDSEEPKKASLKKWTIRIAVWGLIIFAIVKWPQGVGAVLAGGAILLLVLIVWIKYKIRKWLEPLSKLTNMLNPTITLLAREQVTWKHPEAAEELIATLQSLGFKEVGRYELEETDGAAIFAGIDEKNSIFAAFYDLPAFDLTLDFVTSFQDGSVFTATNSKIANFLERPPGNLVVRQPGMNAADLLRVFMKNKPDKPALPIVPEDFVPQIQKYHKELMQWQTVFAENCDRLNRELREVFLRTANWSAVEWDRKQNRVVIIHDQMRKSDVVEAYVRALPSNEEGDEDENSRKKVEAIAEETTRIAAFERMIQEVPINPSFEKVTELTAPVPACVYLSPVDSEEEEENE